MAFDPPTPVAVGSVLTASKYNQEVVDNTQALYDAIGLWLVKTETYSAAATMTIDDAFSSEYDNYRVIIRFSPSTTITSTAFVFRAGGSDNTSALYGYKVIRFSSADSNLTGQAQANGRTQTSAQVSAGGAGGSTQNGIALDVASPFLAQPTTSTGMLSVEVGNVESISIGHTGSTSFDGFKITPNTGTLTGSIAVYGYKK